MNQRIYLILTTVGSAVVGLIAGRVWFLPLLKVLFPVFERKIIDPSTGEVAGATASFGLGVCVLFGLVPVAALVTERFAAQAKYLPALVKTILIGLLAFGTSWIYQHEHLASLDRIAARMPGLFGSGDSASATLAGNPLTKIVWFTIACLLIFGPVDLWIANLQKQWRTRKSTPSVPETAPGGASLPEK